MKHVLVDIEHVRQIHDELNLESKHSGEYLWRGKKRYEATLERVKEYPTPDAGYELGFMARGSIANLRFLEVGEVEKRAEEVTVRVMASGLNFRDVLNVLGMYPGDPGKMGGDIAGWEVESGKRVMGFAGNGGGFAGTVNTAKELVVPIFDGVTFAEAASVPVIYCTALAVMEEYGREKLKGSDILVHAAAGGVGVATAQLAIAKYGCRNIFGSASTLKKKRFAQL